MNRTRLPLLAAALCLLAVSLAPAPATAATAAPAWTLTLTPLPANFAPGGRGEYLAVATNVGGEATNGEATVIEVTLPPGMSAVAGGFEARSNSPGASPADCTEVSEGVRCESAAVLKAGRLWQMKVTAEVEGSTAEGTLEAKAAVSGGGGSGAKAIVPTAIQPGPVPFGFLAGFAGPADNEDGSPAVAAGSHPYQQTLDFGFPTKNPGDGMTAAGHPRDFYFKLPRGLLGNPAATQVLCTEAELTSNSCPEPAQVGLTDVTSLLDAGANGVFTSPIYNMVPPPGYPAELATDAANAGIYVHILPTIRSGEGFVLQAAVPDVIAFGTQPIFGAQSQLWGDPSAKAHDQSRGECQKVGGSCEVDPAETPFLTMPGDCPATPLLFRGLADSWEKPSPPASLVEAQYESADLAGNPVSIEGCGELEFQPTIEARPSTTAADSPAGLDFKLHMPQEEPRKEPLSGRGTAILKDAAVAFPAGLAVNPSQANGLGACSEAQIGFKGAEGKALHFSEDPQSCPDAAKIGTVTATSPLLVQRDEEHEVEIDPETGAPEPQPLHGSLYLAQPFANPFNSLLAVYLAIEDEELGIVAKLAGEGHLDPATGQITTTFAESPELPIEDIEVHIFGGDRGALVTPPSCATYTTQANLTPWSAPEGEDASPSAPFEIDAAAAGGPCPAALPNTPSLSAGTLAPAAGKYSPLVFKLSRPDGSERLSRIEASMPAGLSAKLAGVAQCSEADIAGAIARETPNQGAAEIAHPSCPAASQVGTVNVAAGAGPSPFHTQGKAYLSGPYKNAPLSFVIITPAVAGPFDLGVVVSRVATYLDPETARVRAVSDPLPQLIDGIPVDVRSVALSLDRPGFTLNPTSCAEKAFEGTATSVLGHPAPLFQRFQVGGCKSLPYKPKLSARLFGPIHRGGHPRFRAVLRAKPGEANTAAFALTLPRSEFIDQAHFRTICTRVQFAASQCPAGSIYGYVKAKSPLVDYTLEGPVYLRSSSHELPDTVAALRGPPSQPIEIDAVARIDSVKGGLRARVQTVPDAPVSKVIVTLQGAKKGLFQNSTNICKGTFRMSASFTGQNAKTYDTKPKLNAQCAKGKGGKGKAGR